MFKIESEVVFFYICSLSIDMLQIRADPIENLVYDIAN